MPRFILHFLLLPLALIACQAPPVSEIMHHSRTAIQSGDSSSTTSRTSTAPTSKYYRDGETKRTHTQWYNHWRWVGSGTSDVLAVPLVDCILDNSFEYMKSEMSAANVVLGLTPSILASLGSSVGETSMQSVVGNRPILALCLSAGSLAVEPLQLFQYHKLAGVLDDWTIKG
ncbi:hypothetical protein ACHAQJ_005818 [Trichoderma viride]